MGQFAYRQLRKSVTPAACATPYNPLDNRPALALHYCSWTLLLDIAKKYFFIGATEHSVCVLE
jgi:hypothetical protein